MPNLFNYIMVPVDHMRSKAFSKSKKTAATILFSMKAILISLSSLVSWSIVDLLGLKPDWQSDKWLFPSRCDVSLVATIVSMVLQMQDVREMGLYDAGSILSLLGFFIGIIVANFQSLGTTPLDQDSFITFNSSNLDESGSCLSIS